MSTSPETPQTDQTAVAVADPGTEDDVYLLTVTGHDYTDIAGIYDTLQGAQNHYGAISPVNPWKRVVTFGEPTDNWHTTFASGNHGRSVTIRKMTIRRAHRP